MPSSGSSIWGSASGEGESVGDSIAARGASRAPGDEVAFAFFASVDSPCLVSVVDARVFERRRLASLRAFFSVTSSSENSGGSELRVSATTTGSNRTDSASKDANGRGLLSATVVVTLDATVVVTACLFFFRRFLFFDGRRLTVASSSRSSSASTSRDSADGQPASFCSSRTYAISFWTSSSPFAVERSSSKDSVGTGARAIGSRLAGFAGATSSTDSSATLLGSNGEMRRCVVWSRGRSARAA